jgi:putative hydrolase of the HAD superfamily
MTLQLNIYKENKEGKIMYKNYIFDLYGTLVDISTNENSAYLWKKMQEFYSFYGAKYSALELKKEYNRLCKEEEKKLRQYDYPEIKVEYVFQKMFENKGVTIDIEKSKIVGQFFRIISTKYVQLYDDTIEVLELLKKKNKKIYLLSNAQRIFTYYEMEHLDIIKYFDGILYSSDESCRKPSTEFYNRVLDKYKLEKAESIMIGNDWISDIEGANMAGLDSVYLHTNISPKNTIINNVQATYVFEDGKLANIKKIIR